MSIMFDERLVSQSQKSSLRPSEERGINGIQRWLEPVAHPSARARAALTHIRLRLSARTLRASVYVYTM